LGVALVHQGDLEGHRQVGRGQTLILIISAFRVNFEEIKIVLD